MGAKPPRRGCLAPISGYDTVEGDFGNLSVPSFTDWLDRNPLFKWGAFLVTVGGGTGLGLAISYQIVVEKHGGQLKCFSEVGQGTEFVIEIPIKPKTQLALI